MLALEALQTVQGQALGAVVFAVFWMAFIERVHGPLQNYVLSCAWWPNAFPNQKNTMVNFGFPKDMITEKRAAWAFVWIITMCITHMASALLMIPVVVLGWGGAGVAGQTLFILGTLSEVGFDIYDWLRLVSLIGDQVYPVPLKLFALLCGCHHTTVLSMVIPMNLKYAHLPEYHYIGFSLLFSAGVCYISGHYKFTVNAKTPTGLLTCKAIVTLQFVMNYISRLFIYFPAAYSALMTFHENKDSRFFYGGLVGMVGMGLYNVVVLVDATTAAAKWLAKTNKL